jgi:hypothetical protein
LVVDDSQMEWSLQYDALEIPPKVQVPVPVATTFTTSRSNACSGFQIKEKVPRAGRGIPKRVNGTEMD